MLKLLSLAVGFSFVHGQPNRPGPDNQLPASAETSTESIELVSFDPNSDAYQEMYTTDDPVMGGTSSSNIEIDDKNQVAVWEGTVNIVSFLNAPGFCLAQTYETDFPDATGATELSIRAMTTGAISEFYWYIQSAGNSDSTVYQASFELPNDGAWHEVSTPLDEFTLSHYGVTLSGGLSLEDELFEISQIGVIAESEGDFHFELEWIRGEIPSSSPSQVDVVVVATEISLGVFEITYETDAMIGGFEIEDCALTASYGGKAADKDFMISTGASSGIVIAFSFTGETIDGSGILVDVEGTFTDDCVFVFADADGTAMSYSLEVNSCGKSC